MAEKVEIVFVLVPVKVHICSMKSSCSFCHCSVKEGRETRYVIKPLFGDMDI